MTGDWLDSVLRPSAIADDGFAERVIAVGQAQRRTRLLLRAVVIALLLGVLAAYGAGVVLTATERWDGNAMILDDGHAWLERQRPEFRAALVALDERPALRRRSGRDASPLLDVVERELLDRASPRARACEGELGGDKQLDATASRCDTTFIDGLAAFDEWRWTRDVRSITDPALASPPFAGIVRTHLRRAAAVDDGGKTFAAAAQDAVALGRLLLGHSYMGALVLRTVAEETERAGARSGGFTAPLTADEASQAFAVWIAAVSYGSASGSPDDVAFLRDHDRSVLSCALRSDAFGGDLAMQDHYVVDELRERNRSWGTEGCSPRPSGVAPWLLFGDERTSGTAIASFVSRLPGVRAVIARVVTQPRSRIEIKRMER